MMTTQKPCSRDDCKPQHVQADLTTFCSDCRTVIHLPCIGIHVKFSQIDLPNIRIICNECVNKLSKPAAQIPTSSQEKTIVSPKTTPTTNDMKTIVEEVRELRELIMKNGNKLNEIDTKTTVLVEKAIVQPAFAPINSPIVPPPQMNPLISFTPNSSRRPRNSRKNPYESQKPPATLSYADAARQNDSQNSAKRKRSEPTVPSAMKITQKAKVGTRSSTCGLTVYSQPKRNEKPKFDRAIWVSRFDRYTTVEEISDYILAETDIDDKSEYSVHKLVKKDCELDSLRFVSFKIQVNEDNFAVLMDPEMWPTGIRVREFLNNTTLGDHIFPALGKKNGTTSTEAMEIEAETSQRQPSSKTNSPEIILTSPAPSLQQHAQK